MNLKLRMFVSTILALSVIAAPAQVRRSTTTSGSNSSAQTSGQTVRRSTTNSGSNTTSQPVRRSSDTEKAARQQQKVDQQQQPTNVANQPKTNREVTQAAQDQRRNATTRPAEQKPAQNTQSAAQQNTRQQDARRSTTRQGQNAQQPAQPSKNQPAPGKSAQPAPSGGHSQVVVRSSAPLPPRATVQIYHPRPAPIPRYTPAEIHTRTNASQIVIYTTFRTREEAFNYLVNLLYDRYYDIASYRYFTSLTTVVTPIPTPSGWTRPDTHNQFRMHFDIGKRCSGVKITVTAEWRESVLEGYFTGLRYQPSNQYSTYYAWNVLEDIAYAIPSTRVIYR